MMKRWKVSAGWGLLAVAVYAAIVGIMLAYFDYKRHNRPKRYVQKNDDAIRVALAAPSSSVAAQPLKRPHTSRRKPKKAATPKSQSVRKTKPTRSAKTHTKRKSPSKVRKNVVKRDTNRTRRRRQKSAKELFASLPSAKRPHITVSSKPLPPKTARQLFTMVDAKPRKDAQHSLKKQRRKERGVEDAYLAKVQRMLEDWPSQSDFAGERVKVYLKIRPSGYFEFEFKQKADNPAFNEALRAYLEQLQTIGFGPHKGKRTYLFEAEFVAKE